MSTAEQDEWLRKLGVGAIGRVVSAGATADAGAAMAGSSQPTPGPATTPQIAAKVDLGDEAAAAERRRLLARITAAKRNAAAALERYQDQRKINDDQRIISGLARAAKEVTSLGKFADPGPALNRILLGVRATARSAYAALDVNDFEKADGICTQMDESARKAHTLARSYSDDLIDGAETAKTTVKVVDTGAKVVGGVALTVATGGAAAGVLATNVATATAISVAGGVAASTAGVATRLALGEKVDWGLFSIDILMQGLLARFGGKLTEGIAAAVAQRLGPLAATIGGAVIKNVAAQAVMHVNTTMSKAALETAYQKVNGRALTLQQVYDSCIEQLTDPSSIIVAAATAAAQGHVDAKATATAGSPAAPRDAIPAPPGRPPSKPLGPPPEKSAKASAEATPLFSADDIAQAFDGTETGGLKAVGDLIQLGPHGAASRNRQEIKVSGRDVESGHLAPQAVMKNNVVDYNAEHALTILLKKIDHKGMDASWKKDFKAMRAAGETTATAQTIFDAVANSIRKAPGLKLGQKNSLVAALTDEMFMQRGLKPTDLLELPYPNVKSRKAK